MEHDPSSRGRAARLVLVLGALGACSGRGSDDAGFSPGTGTVVAKPEGGFFVADAHHGGRASRLELVEIGWGRRVDVHDVDAAGVPSAIPVLRDVVIAEGVLSDGVDVTLVTHPITHESRLVILRPRAAPDTGAGDFESILRRVSANLSGVLPKADDGTASLPVSFVARNGALLLHFDDLLEDGPEARATLHEQVRLACGYPPDVPQPARIVFDPSHGGLAEGRFHSTRVLLDFTVSEQEALELPIHVAVNAAGLPASARGSPQPNASLHLPTRLDPPAGRFARLTNLAGRGVEPQGPVEAATGDLVRAFRSGGVDDGNRGFLLDLAAPRLVGSWDVRVEAAHADALGPTGFGFVLDLRFLNACRAAPGPLDTLQLGGELYEVRTPAPAPALDGRVPGVRVLRFGSAPLANAAALLGEGRLLTPYVEGPLPRACWLSFIPPPRAPPERGLDTATQVRLRFSEPMDPESFRVFDSFRLLRGPESDEPVLAGDLVVGRVRAEQNLQEFTLLPSLPFDNRDELVYRFELVAGEGGVRDLTGSQLAGTFTRAEFELEEGQPTRANGGLALRFASRDELPPLGLDDLRGQVSYDPVRELLQPRSVLFASFPADRSVPLLNLMAPFAFGVQTPLSPLGSKLQTVWRYADFRWRVREERFHNIDVIGLYWSPLAGALVSDFYPLFEMRLAHSRYLPDESILTNLAPRYPISGLPAFNLYADNVIEDVRGPQVVVHPRELGYRVRPADLTQSPRGTPLLPFPWNRAGGPLTTYTWRDTTIQARGGQGSPGIPLDVEVGPPLGIETAVGEVAGPGEVPSIGLPLLWEIRCFPTAGGLGLNSFDILLPVPGFPGPNFRAFSTGGIDQAGRAVAKDPDLELRPSGGFNPTSTPPGRPTPLSADNSFYVGQIDTVVRVSRAVTVWMDTGNFAPRFTGAVMEPRTQVGRTQVLAEFRGADDFAPEAGNAPFDAAALDVYGDLGPGQIQFHGDGSWSSAINAADGARFLQVRFTFLNDIEALLSPELDSFGLAWEED